MSKHEPRKSRWTQLNAKEYRAAFGVVRYHAGAWEGSVSYDLRQPPQEDGAEIVWQPRNVSTGRFKRPRNAMLSVEEQARLLLRRHGADVRIAFRDR